MKYKFILFSPWLLKSPDKGSIKDPRGFYRAFHKFENCFGVFQV